MKIRTKHCAVCNIKFSFKLKKGRRPVTCGDECRLLRIKTTNAHSPVIRNFNCVVCNLECEQTGLGPLKKYCVDCNPRRIGGNTRDYTCTECDKDFLQTGKGYLRKRCPDCASTYRSDQKRPLIIRTYECERCNKIYKQNGKGRGRKRCADCAVSNNKEYKKSLLRKKVIRSYICINCDTNFIQKGRGRLRKRCVSCAPKKHKIDKDTEAQEEMRVVMGGLFE